MDRDTVIAYCLIAGTFVYSGYFIFTGWREWRQMKTAENFYAKWYQFMREEAIGRRIDGA
jgi:hypothetical protein